MISPKALALIQRFEGIDQPHIWPGGQSGVTIGYGYDLGYVSLGQFSDDWRGKMSDSDFHRLFQCVKLKGLDAKRAALDLRGIVITPEAARDVLLRITIPREEATTKATFPGVENLPADAFGALVSLIYNRGPLLIGESRTEMAAIVPLVAKGCLIGIAAQIRAMKRLWIGKKMDGLIQRREAEAQLVESCSTQESSCSKN